MPNNKLCEKKKISYKRRKSKVKCLCRNCNTEREIQNSEVIQKNKFFITFSLFIYYYDVAST